MIMNGRVGKISLPAIGVRACFFISALSLTVAPVLMPADYTWIVHTTSESAAQCVDGAWLARFGFLLFGLGVMWLAALAAPVWGRVGTLLHTLFGVFMIAAAVFSSRSWNPEMPFDRIEDLFHSIAATAMGFAFAGGVFVILLRRARDRKPYRRLDFVAVGASFLIPLAMGIRADLAGLLQRVMFLIAYVWYGREAYRIPRIHEEENGVGEKNKNRCHPERSATE